MSKLSIVRELWGFMRERKKWWLFPMIVIIVLLGILLVVAQTSPVAPLIYTFI